MSQKLVILSKLYAIEKLLEELVPEAKTFLEDHSKVELERLKKQETLQQQKMLELLEKKIGLSSTSKGKTKQDFDFVLFSDHHDNHNDET